MIGRSMILFAFICNAFILAQAGEISRKQYLELAEHSPKLIDSQGDYSKGEIQIVIDPKEMAAIEKESARDVGILMQDRYWLWVNDACIFPSGARGVYGRILWVKSLDGYPGVAVMPVTSDEKVILNCNFRHATRSWEIELPRGCVDAGEGLEAAARRETVEETGMVVSDLVLLGKISPDTGISNTIVPVYMAKVIGKQESQPEDSEAIEDILCLTISEVKQAFLKGYLNHKIRGEQKRIPFRDPFLAYALLLYELKQSELPPQYSYEPLKQDHALVKEFSAEQCLEEF